MKGSYPAARSLCGTKGGNPQFCPFVLNSSGGAPTLTPFANESCHAHASAPFGSTPIGRSCIKGICSEHRDRWLSSSHCTHLRNVMRSAFSCAKAAIASLFGCRYCSGHSFHPVL